jgi:tRNA dimethylallyltransferase
LERVDPETAATIDPRNPRRLVRALEVFHATGRSITELQTEWRTETQPRRSGRSDESDTERQAVASRSWENLSDCPAFCLDRDRAELHGRIEGRIEQQLAGGWADEVRALMDHLDQAGPGASPTDRTALQAAGYRQLVAYIRGELGWADTVAQIKARTRQLARRQITWFRRETGLTWMQIEPDEPPLRTAQRILSHLPA